MFNYLVLQHGDATLVPKSVISEAIVRIGNDTPHYHETYEPLIIDRLRDHDWIYFPYKEMWSPNEDQAAEMLTMQLKDIEAELLGEEPLQTWEESDSGDVEADTEVERAQNLWKPFRNGRNSLLIMG